MRTALMTFIVLTLFGSTVIAQSEDPAGAIDKASTVAEIETAVREYEQASQNELEKIYAIGNGELKESKLDANFKKITAYFLAAGKKAVSIAKDDAEKLIGYKLLTEGYQIQNSREMMAQLKKIETEQGFKDEKDPQKVGKLLAALEKFETEASKKLSQLYDEIEKEGKQPELVAEHKARQFMQKGAAVAGDFSQEKFDAFVQEAKQFINTFPQHAENIFQSVLQVAGWQNPDLQKKTKTDLLDFLKSADCKLVQESKDEVLAALVAEERRALGAELNLYGRTIDDKDFAWKDVLAKNKVVLVKFTASWCGPCKGQIPGMKTAYEKYRSKGFEIVEVYVWDKLDDTKKAVEEEKLPWLFVHEELTEKAGGKPQGKFYGIEGVPTMLLVGKDGKVIDTEARGKHLQDTLAKLFEENGKKSKQ